MILYPFLDSLRLLLHVQTKLADHISDNICRTVITVGLSCGCQILLLSNQSFKNIVIDPVRKLFVSFALT